MPNFKKAKETIKIEHLVARIILSGLKLYKPYHQYSAKSLLDSCPVKP